MTKFPEYREPISFWSTSGVEWSSPLAGPENWLAEGAAAGHQEIQA